MHRNISQEIRRQSLYHAGISVHAHMLRHSKAMHLKTYSKLSPDQIAKALGHANVTTTLAFYLHGVPGAKEQRIPLQLMKRKEA
jgi:integrase